MITPAVRELSLTILLRAGFEGREQSNGDNQPCRDNGRGSILAGLFNFRREHPKKTVKNGNLAHESYHHRPFTRPTIVDMDYRKTSNEQR